MIPWLCTSIASPLRIRPRGERSSGKSPKRAPPRKNPKICKNCSRTLVSIGFVCYLLSCCVAFFNRECLGETRQVSIFPFPVSKRFLPRKRGLRTLLVRSRQQEDSFPDVTITKPFSGPKSGKMKN